MRYLMTQAHQPETAMKTIDEIRHTRLLQLLQQPDYPTIQALATAIKRNAAQVSQWKNRSKRGKGGVCNIDSESARNIERMTDKPRGWMDNDPEHDSPAPPEPPPPQMSSMGSTVAGWLDGLPEEKRNKAFWLIHQMVFADEWPAPAPAPLPATVDRPAPSAPSSEPSPEPSPVARR